MNECTDQPVVSSVIAADVLMCSTDPLATTSTCRTYSRLSFHDGQLFDMEEDELAVETAVAMVYNDGANVQRDRS